MYTVGSFNELKAEYVRMIFVKDYSLNPNDGQFSREFFSRLDIDKYKLTFDGTTVAYIEKDGTYKLSRDRKYLENSHNFLELYDKAREEHRVKAISTVEEETGEETSKTNAEEIFEDAREELHQETVTVGETLAEQAERLEREGKLTTQERRELGGISDTKGLPKT